MWDWLSQLLTRRPMQTILITSLILTVMTAGAFKIVMATGNETMIDEETPVFQDNQALESEFGGESIIVLHEGQKTEDLMSVENLKKMKELETKLNHYDEVYSVISPVTLVEQMAEKQGEKYHDGIMKMNQRLNQGPMSAKDSHPQPNPSLQPDSQLKELKGNIEKILAHSDILHPGLPQKQKTLNAMIYDKNGKLRKQFEEVIAEDRYMVMMVQLNGNMDDEKKTEIAKFIKQEIGENPLHSVETTVSGKPVLDGAVRTSMRESMKKMVGLAVLFMAIVLAAIFRVPWRLLSLPIILAAVIPTIGFMGWISIPMTMVSMAAFPVLIGLGVDYMIQFQNRYGEEMRKGEGVSYE